MEKKVIEDISKTESLDTLEQLDSKSVNRISAFFNNFIKKLRLSFASQCEESVLANAIDKLYTVFLYCNIRFIAVFLTSLSISSLLMNYLVLFNGVDYIFTVETISTLAILLIGILMFTSKKTVGELLSSSKVLSQLTIVYSQNAIISFDNVGRKNSWHSSALFSGIILGILSIIYPVSGILLFLICVIYFVFILNKPECGLALAICTFAFSDSNSILFISLITFAALIYKFFRCKRHIEFNSMFLVMLISIVYFLFRGYFTQSGIRSIPDTFSYVSFILTCILTVSLITSTSILNRSIRLVVIISRIYTVVFLCYYASLIVFSPVKVFSFIDKFYLNGISEGISNISFFAPFIAIMLPLNFATMLASKNASGFIKNVVYFICMLLCTSVVSSFAYTMILLIACVLILFIYNKKFIFLIFPTPVVAFFLVKIYDYLPDAYAVSVLTQKGTVGSSAAELLKSNAVFGIGIGRTNFSHVISSSEVYVNSTILDLMLKIGFVGVALILTVIAFMVVKNIAFIVTCDPAQSYKVRITSAGVLASSLAFLANCFYMDCLFDFRIVFLFSLIISLGYVSGKCIDSDYIDATMVREYKQF